MSVPKTQRNPPRLPITLKWGNPPEIPPIALVARLALIDHKIPTFEEISHVSYFHPSNLKKNLGMKLHLLLFRGYIV